MPSVLLLLLVSSALLWKQSLHSGLCMLMLYILILFDVEATTQSFDRYQPSTCEIPACDNDTDLCPGSIVCEPIPPPVFNVIDAVCIYIFTIEYGVRLFTCWGASSK